MECVSPLLIFDTEETVEHLAEGAHMVQIVEDNHRRQLTHRRVLTLLCDVGQVLTQLLCGLVVHVKRRHRACSQLLARSANIHTLC